MEEVGGGEERGWGRPPKKGKDYCKVRRDLNMTLRYLSINYSLAPEVEG